jgi:AcrR family transcriptional regulator
MKRLSSQERRRKIIQAAVTLFSERGFSGATTRELAGKAGISEALLFRHFPDKKKLYQAILKSKMEEQIPALFEAFPQNGSLRETLRELAFRIARQNAKDSSFMKLLLFSALEGHELSDLFFQRRTLPLVDFLKRRFRGETRNGRLKKHDPDLAARAFLAMVFGFVQTRNLFRIPQLLRRPLEKTLGTYVEIFLKGVEK